MIQVRASSNAGGTEQKCAFARAGQSRWRIRYEIECSSVDLVRAPASAAVIKDATALLGMRSMSREELQQKEAGLVHILTLIGTCAAVISLSCLWGLPWLGVAVTHAQQIVIIVDVPFLIIMQLMIIKIERLKRTIQKIPDHTAE
jgi:hypothetical protein